jgi:hypothetical protein
MVVALAALPDQEYETVGEVWVALGGHREPPRGAISAGGDPAPAPASGAAPAPLQLLVLPVAVGLRVAVGAVHVAGDVVRRARVLVGRFLPSS